jgi:hypothetical protein
MGCQAGRTLFTNFALRELSTAAYNKQQTHLRPIAVVIDHGIWPMDFSDNKNKIKISSSFTI